VGKIALRYAPYPETDILLSEFFITFLYKKLRKHLPCIVWPSLGQDAIGRIRGFCQSDQGKSGTF
jgi:hypothetical protein